MPVMIAALLLAQKQPVILAVDRLVVAHRSGANWIATDHAYGTTLNPMRFYSFGVGKLGRTLDGVKLEDGGDVGGAMLATDKAEGQVHISGIQPKLSRKVSSLPSSEPSYLGRLKVFLKAQGLASVTPRITRLITADLDGNGRAEVLLEARNRENVESLSSKWTNKDYSAVLLISGATVIPLEFVSFAKHETMELKRLRGIADLDGDGTMEIVTDGQGYEWTNVKLWAYRQGKLTKLIENGAGA